MEVIVSGQSLYDDFLKRGKFYPDDAWDKIDDFLLDPSEASFKKVIKKAERNVGHNNDFHDSILDAVLLMCMGFINLLDPMLLKQCITRCLEIETQSYKTVAPEGAIAFLKRMWNNRKMLLKYNAMLEDLRGRKNPSVLVVKRIKQLEMARAKMLHDQK